MWRHTAWSRAHFCCAAAVRRDLPVETGTSCLIWPTSPEELILCSEIIETQMNVNESIMDCRRAAPSPRPEPARGIVSLPPHFRPDAGNQSWESLEFEVKPLRTSEASSRVLSERSVRVNWRNIESFHNESTGAVLKALILMCSSGSSGLQRQLSIGLFQVRKKRKRRSRTW